MNYLQLNETHRDLSAKLAQLELADSFGDSRKEIMALRRVVAELSMRMAAVRAAATEAVLHAAAFLAAGDASAAVRLAEAARNLRQGNPDFAAAAAREAIKMSLGDLHREAQAVKAHIGVITQEEAIAAEAVFVYKNRAA